MPKPYPRIFSAAAASIVVLPTLVLAAQNPGSAAQIPAGQVRPSIPLQRDTVIPVVVENNLTLSRLQEGDRFTAHVDHDPDLPEHTRLIGRVYRIRESRRRDLTVNLEFTDVILPDGSRHRIDAVPVSLDDKYVDHREDGRIVVKNDYRTGRDYVAEGAIGGFLIGSMIHRRFTGTIVGALVGAIAADSERQRDEYVLKKGQRIGALIERDTTLEFYPGARSERAPRPSDSLPPVIADRPRGDRGADDRTPPPAADGGIVLNYDGKDLNFDSAAKPFRIGDVVMVPLQRTATQLSLTVDRGKDTVVYVEGDDSSLRMELDSADARLNGRKVTLASPLQDRGGVLYLPIEVLASMKKGAFLVNGTKVKTVDSGDGSGG
jgi:hypothetical protein